MSITTTSYRSVVGLPPSPLLLALLQNTPPADVHGRELTDRMSAIRRLRNHCEALLVLHIAELAQRRPADPNAPIDPFHIQEVEKYCADEIALALRMTLRTARGHLETATLLHDRLPTVITALKDGYLDLWSARAILDETLHLSDAEAAQVAGEVLKIAADKTLGEIRALARRLALRITPKETEKAARKRAQDARRVRLYNTGDGNAELVATLTAAEGAVIWEIINSAAWQALRADKHVAELKKRGIDQARADVLVDLIIGLTQPDLTAPQAPADHEDGCEHIPHSKDSKDSKDDAAPSEPENAQPARSNETGPDAERDDQPRPGAEPRSDHEPAQDAETRSDSGPAQDTEPASRAARPAHQADPHGQEPGHSEASDRRPPNPGSGSGSAKTHTSAPPPTRDTQPPNETQPCHCKDTRRSRTTSLTRTNVDITMSFSQFLVLLIKNAEAARKAAEQCAGSPAEVSGIGVVGGWIARDIVRNAIANGDARFRAIIYDDDTGELIAATSPGYRLPADLTRHIHARDRVCRFPGCRQPARHCDIDHVKAWQRGGITSACNLQCLCRHHHQLKQNKAWDIGYDGGRSSWSPRTGHLYESQPHDYRDQPLPPLPLDQDHDEPPDDDHPPDRDCHSPDDDRHSPDDDRQ